MFDSEKVCLNCFKTLTAPKTVCPSCGCDNSTVSNESHQLECGSILAGTYLVGKVLGQGGFGITYVGWDLNLDMKVAIKEYYPEGFVTRDTHTQAFIVSFAGTKAAYFQKGKERFVEEARTLARFSGDSGIVGVRAFFYENGTAYIVMDFVEGETLKACAARRGGKLPSSEVLSLFRPLIQSLARVHDKNLLHRDISPDNMIIRPDGTLALLDFGAARQISSMGERSNTINVKQGYAPEEQYRTHGEQGPWTDVYALCATIYRLTTGVTPDEALDRMVNENELTPPNQLGADLTPEQEKAVLHGLAVKASNRTQNMRDLLKELNGATEENPRIDPNSVNAGKQERIDAIPYGHASKDAGKPDENKQTADKKKRTWLQRTWAYVGLGVVCFAAISIAVISKSCAPATEPYDTANAAANDQVISEDPVADTAIPTAPALIRVGIINNPPTTSRYRAANVADFENIFTEANGYATSTFYSVKNDEQLNAAKQFITDGVDYLLISASATSGWDAVLASAKEAGIKVFLFDRIITTDESSYEAAVVSSMANEGVTAVEWLKAQKLDSYKVIHIQGAMGSDAQIGRTAALDAEFAAGTMTKVVQQSAMWDEATAKQIVESAINSGKKFNVIYAENDGMAKGAVAALDEAGITHGVGKAVIVMGFDCNRWALRELLAGNWNYDGQCSPFQAAVISDMIMKLEAGETLAEKKVISEERGFDATTITQDDIDTYGLGE